MVNATCRRDYNNGHKEGMKVRRGGGPGGGESVPDMNIWRKNAWATVPFLDENKIPALVKIVKDAGGGDMGAWRGTEQ